MGGFAHELLSAHTLYVTSHGSGSFRPKPISAWNSLFRPLSRSFIVALGYIVWFGSSLADYITKLLVGQGCFLRLCGRVDASYIILTIFQ